MQAGRSVRSVRVQASAGKGFGKQQQQPVSIDVNMHLLLAHWLAETVDTGKSGPSLKAVGASPWHSGWPCMAYVHPCIPLMHF